MLIKLLTKTAKPPRRQTSGAAGYDIHSDEEIVVPAQERKLVSTGFAVGIPKGYYGRIASRSGWAVKKSIDVAAGVVDNDYRGEVKVLLVNNGKEDFKVSKGDRIAQIILESIAICEIEVVDELEDTDRDSGGFGSTGTN